MTHTLLERAFLAVCILGVASPFLYCLFHASLYLYTLYCARWAERGKRADLKHVGKLPSKLF